MHATARPRARGFTLVELLVVIAIIGALAAIAIPAIGSSRRRAATSMAKNQITELNLALSQYQGQFGDFPPSSIEEFYDLPGNNLDSGIESIVLHLSTRKRGGPFVAEWDEDHLENLDGDAVASPELKLELDWVFGDDQLRELVDPWGLPFIYIHNRDYERAYAITHGETRGRGTAQAGRSEKTATFHSPTGYQLWSSGPNQQNENGGGDDIVSW